jgi:FkbM family methyltransferase
MKMSLPYGSTERNTTFNKIVVKIRRILWQFYSLFLDEIIVSTRQGIFALRTGKNENIGKRLYVYGEYESVDLFRFIAILSQYGYADSLRSGCLLDVGANNGVISIALLRGGVVSKAICIEPDEDNFRALKKNIRINQLSESSYCIPLAVSDKRCELSLELSPDNYGDHRIRSPAADEVMELYRESSRHTVCVESDSLDAILMSASVPWNGEIGLVVIDVQGYEGFVIAGAEKLFQRGVPCMIEVWPYGIKRSGFDENRLFDLVKHYYSIFYTRDIDGNDIQHSTKNFEAFYRSIGVGPKYSNILLLNG